MGSRRTEAQKWRRDRIIEAAASVFVRRGFHGATMDEIAREADYSTPSLYNYFKNKEEIFAAVVAETSRRFTEAPRDPLPDDLTIEQRLLWMLRRLFTLAEQHRDLFVAFVAQRGFFEWDLRADLGEAAYASYVEAIGLFEREMERGAAAGVLRRDADPAELAGALVGIINGYLFRWLMGSEEIPLQAQAERIVDLFLRGAEAS